MESCYVDNCKKQEWLRLRKLRLLQVREQSKVVSQETLRRSKEMQEKQKTALRSQREHVLEEWKREKIKDLELKYNEAMEKVGLANKVAAALPDSDEVLEERRARNAEMASRRGNVALQRQLEAEEMMREKENAPLRRKELIRNIEDIRSGLVVQARDWSVINQVNKQVLLDIPVTNVSDFRPREPLRQLPFAPRPASARTVCISPEDGKKTGRSGRHQPYPTRSPNSTARSPRSPIVPALKNITSNRSSQEEKSPKKVHKDKTEAAMSNFHDQLSRCAATYRLNEDLRHSPQRYSAPSNQQPYTNYPYAMEGVRPMNTCYRPPPSAAATANPSCRCPPQLDFGNGEKTRPMVDLCVCGTRRYADPPPAEVVEDDSQNDELAMLLQKYRSSQVSEREHAPRTVRQPLSPLKLFARENRSIAKKLTSPKKLSARETRKPSTSDKKTRKLNQKSRETSSRGETQRLLRQVDKALEEGRRLGEAISMSVSPESSAQQSEESDSDSDAVVKLIVNVNCRTEGESTTARSQQPEQRNVGTVVGESLEEKCASEAEETLKPAKKKPVKQGRDGKCKQYVRTEGASRTARRPVDQRNVGTVVSESLEEKSSTSDVPRRPVQQWKEQSPVKGCKCKQCCHCSSAMRRTSTLADLSWEKEPPVVDISSIVEEGQQEWQDAGVQTSLKSATTGTGASQSGWSSTVYLSPPRRGRQREVSDAGEVAEPSFKFNPVLDYYIRKVLDMPPDAVTRASSRDCLDCDCASAAVSQGPSVQTTPSSRRPTPTRKSTSIGAGHKSNQISSNTQRNLPSKINEEAKPEDICRSLGSAICQTLGVEPISQSTATSFDIGNTLYKALASFDDTLVSSGEGQRKSLMSADRQKSFEEESQRRLKRIAALKVQLEEIRKQQEKISSSSSGSPESSASRQQRDSASVHSSSSHSSSSHDKPSAVQQNQINKFNLPDLESAHRLSTIIEIDSRVQTSEIRDESFSKDPMAEMIRRKLISKPFDWTQGAPLTDVNTSSASSSTEPGDEITFHTLPAAADAQNLADRNQVRNSSSSSTFPGSNWLLTNTSGPPQSLDRSGISLQDTFSSPEKDLQRLLAQLEMQSKRK